MAGHSLGEYAALVCADALTLEDAAELVQKRGRLMQEAMPIGRGAMAAIIGLSDDEVDQLCTLISQDEMQVSVANYNAIGQVVVAGHTPLVHQLIKRAEEKGARMAKLLPVSVPCHCALLQEIANEFHEALKETPFKKPSLSVISNVDLSVYQDVDQIRNLLTQQLYMPVRWVETIQLIKNKNIEKIIECGPGKVLSGLIKRIDKTIATLTTDNIEQFSKTMSFYNEQVSS